MVVEDFYEKEVETTEHEDFAEYLWRDFYEVKRKLITVRMTNTFEL
ncbi:MAG: hypothetical protein QE164_06885 [Candidatus Nezhaarchaeota archaeon]|nr:hypothetical protein [Candidatus Nezhaarchaeota archaeon]